ncbi:hypothetical protein P378_02885 [Desulforamulus profundi]|uniref:Uncharacterized protein n=1 Tax=Desulforamulus profundi TaxID=1383067 RepID=A0A2C6L492_9FIRM|nr:hypothetical protein [Desulforamulus profundi]PHJ39681.1 hypothetical protein P378_02885 [Desulforamulus profundi]
MMWIFRTAAGHHLCCAGQPRLLVAGYFQNPCLCSRQRQADSKRPCMVFDRQKLINGELAPFIRVSKEQAASGITDEELDALIQVMMEQEKHQELK